MKEFSIFTRFVKYMCAFIHGFIKEIKIHFENVAPKIKNLNNSIIYVCVIEFIIF